MIQLIKVRYLLLYTFQEEVYRNLKIIVLILFCKDAVRYQYLNFRVFFISWGHSFQDKNILVILVTKQDTGKNW